MLSPISRILLRNSQNSLQRQFSQTSVLNVRTGRQNNLATPKALSIDPEIQIDSNPEEIAKSKEIWSKVNEQISNKSHGRLFAVIEIERHQYKITDEDLVMVLTDIGASIGQRIRLEKALTVGSKDFTLLGRPLLPRDLINIEATVVEKALTHAKVNHYKHEKSRMRRTCFTKEKTTTLRINKIELVKPVDETTDRLGFEKPKNLYF